MESVFSVRLELTRLFSNLRAVMGRLKMRLHVVNHIQMCLFYVYVALINVKFS